MLQVKRQTNGNGSAGGHGHFGAPTSAGRNGKKSRKLDKAYFPVKMSLHARQKRQIFGVWCVGNYRRNCKSLEIMKIIEKCKKNY